MKRAIVIGAGPAGASAALGLLSAGWRVRLIDRRIRWTGRVCGSFLNSEAVHHLHRLNLLDDVRRAGAPAVSRCRVTSATGPAADFPVDARGGGPGLAISRDVLEPILLRAVERRGGEVAFGVEANSVTGGGDGNDVVSGHRTAGGKREPWSETADLTILADGRFTRGRATPPRQNGGWFGWNARFNGARHEPGEMSLHLFPGGYVGTLTFADGSTNVSGLFYLQGEGGISWGEIFDEAIRRQPHLRRALLGAHRTSAWAGVGPLPFDRRARYRTGGPIRVGDAAAVGDPFLGEGIGRGLGAGFMVARAMRQAAGTGRPPEAVYADLWSRAYAARIKFGRITRASIRRPFLFRPVVGGLIYGGAATRALIRSLHRGYVEKESIRQEDAHVIRSKLEAPL